MRRRIVESWHRFYDPATGRYVTADPIGLAGGINLYAYVGGDPVNWVDPSGNIQWTGTYSQLSFTIGIGAVGGWFVLTSDCVNNMKATVTVLVAGISGSVGVEISLTDSNIVFEDYEASIKPSIFNSGSLALGYIDYHGAVAFLQWGRSFYSNVTLGKWGEAWTDLQFGEKIKGVEASLFSLSAGTSTLWDTKWECCP